MPARSDSGHRPRRFWDAFRLEYAAFLGHIENVPDLAVRGRVASVLLHRFLFLYFLRQGGFLNARMHPAMLLDGVASLGHDFDSQVLEAAPGLRVSDAAFGRLLEFFAHFRWRLADRPPADDREVTPHVLGWLGEDRAHRKRWGAYYTGDDVTEYLARTTVVPFLLDEVARACPEHFRPDGPAWRLLRKHPDRYLFATVRHGADAPLPAAVAGGLGDVTGRIEWNRPADPAFGLPTETWREHVRRRQWCADLRRRLRTGAVASVNDLVTCNLDVRRFAADVLRTCDGAVVEAFWRVLTGVKILDPTCGAGAFLFGALRVLEPLYHLCLKRQGTRGETERRSFVVRSILGHNLVGVDLAPEAAEVCRLRLLLRLAGAVRRDEALGPLPDLAGAVRTGNALGVGGLPSGAGDVILGNPPWVEYRPATCPYELPELRTRSCNNLWAFVTERALGLLRPGGRLGFVVPMSLTCAARMAPVQDLLRAGGTSWVANFESDSNPGQLFEGVKQNVSILLHQAGTAACQYTTRLHRFFAEGRPRIFDRVRFQPRTRDYGGPGFAKVGEPLEAAVLDKLGAHPPLAEQLDPGGEPVYVHRIAHYYIKCLDFVPYFRSGRDGLKKSADYKMYRFRRPAGPVVAAVNSSLFYFYWQACFDGFKAGQRCVLGFPCGHFAPAVRVRLGRLCRRLMADYRARAVRLRATYAATGAVEYDQFYPRFSKGILDEIDGVLAGHFGLTPEELDFVVNYDAKFRLGRHEMRAEADCNPLPGGYNRDGER